MCECRTWAARRTSRSTPGAIETDRGPSRKMRNLHGDNAVQLFVLGLVHRTHAAGADLAENAIAIEQDRGTAAAAGTCEASTSGSAGRRESPRLLQLFESGHQVLHTGDDRVEVAVRAFDDAGEALAGELGALDVGEDAARAMAVKSSPRSRRRRSSSSASSSTLRARPTMRPSGFCSGSSPRWRQPAVNT